MGNFDVFMNALDDSKVFTSKSNENNAKSSLLLTKMLGYDKAILDGVKAEKKIKKPEDLKKLVQLDQRDWKTVLTKAKVKTGGTTIDKKLVNFHAKNLVKSIETRFPSEAYVKNMALEKSPIEDDKKVAAFLKRHENLNLKDTKIALFFKENELHTQDDLKVQASLKKHQRLFKLTPKYEHVKGLRKQKIHSAQHLVATGKSRFVNDIAPKSGMSKKEARIAYKKAEDIHTATLLIAGDLQAINHSGVVPSIGPDSLTTSLEKVGEDFPNLKTLFELTDLCECEHCRSVYSPAAYLVELLQFLDKRTTVDTTTTPYTFGRLAKDQLFERRPDLGDLDLSCANANTPVPYIDLVCELLEETVSPNAGTPFNGIITEGAPSNVLRTALTVAGFEIPDTASIFPPDVNGAYILRAPSIVLKIQNTGANQWLINELRQTYGTAEELMAAPYYVNDAAYTILNTEQYAFQLPFDLYHTEAQAYFSRFGVARAALMEAFEVSATPSPETIAAELLGLTDKERILITTPDVGNQKQYWNTAGANPLSEMKVVATMLDKTGLSYTQLVRLLELQFIKKAANPFIKHLDNSCDTAQKEIENLSLPILDRIHRFLRLWKKLDWTLETLDEIIAQDGLGKNILNKEALIVMGNLVQISAQTGVKMTVLIGCYGTIPHQTTRDEHYIPLYHSVFLNKAKNGVLEEGLQPEHITGAPKQLQDHQTALALILQLSENDFEALLTTFSDTFLTWSNLSTLYALVRFSQKKKISIQDMIAYQNLTNMVPFSHPSTTLNFIAHLDHAKHSPIPIQEVQYMLAHEATDLALKMITDDKINAILIQLQSGIQEAYVNATPTYDDALSAEELQAAVKNNLLRLPAMTETIANDFVRMSTGDWNSPPDPDAHAYIDEHLSVFISDTSTLKTAQAALAPNLETEQKAFIKIVLDALSEYFYGLEKEAVVYQIMATAYKQEAEFVRLIMTNALLGQPAPGTDALYDIILGDSLLDLTAIETLPVIDEASYPAHYNALRLLHKLLPLWASFELDPTALAWWIKQQNTFGWIALDTIPYQVGATPIPYAEWEHFILLTQVSKTYSPVENPADLATPFTFQNTMELLVPAVGTTASDWHDRLAIVTGHDRDTLVALDAHFGWSNPDISAYENPLVWMQMDSCMEFLRKMNSSVTQLTAFGKAQLTLADTTALRIALKSRYDETLWLTALQEIMDAIRPQKRDALVAYLLAINPAMKTTNDLYDYFLVDTEMEACMPSSRIVQAHGVLQLFVQRCLMGLEPESAADAANDSHWEQWKWMRNYRVWEANRKVFLYPENWIEPELLDDKSFLFEDLENELLQNELNEYTAEDAVIRYVEKLDDIAFLEVMTSFYEVETYTMHVFARTKGGDPAQYYYRKFEGERYWTPWEKVPLEISSDQLLAFKRNGRLHLAWPFFSEEHNPEQDSTVPAISGAESTQEAEDTKPEKRLKIQLAISQYANGQWKPKKVSQDAIKTPTDYTKYESELDQNIYNLMYVPYGEFVMVFHTHTDDYTESHYTDGFFNIAGCQGYPELLNSTNSSFPDFFPDIADTHLKKQRYFELGQLEAPDNLLIVNLFTFLGFTERLGKTPGSFRITHAFQMNLFDIIGYLFELLLSAALGNSDLLSRYLKLPLGTLFPYFFEDSEHAYVVIPGVYGENEEEDGTPIPIKKTFSNMHKLLLDMIALYQKYIGKWNEDPNQDVEALVAEFQNDPDTLAIKEELQSYRGLTYGEEFKNLYHPLICLIRRTLYSDGVAGIMKRDLQLTQTTFDFESHYAPAPMIVQPYPVEDLDFNSDGSYSAYNWELFYHAPLMIANRLRDDQKFEEALSWYHYMFDPTGTLAGETPQKFWVTKPFYLHSSEDYVQQRIDTLLYNTADPNAPELTELEFAISQWREKPFRPHTVARFRPVAYQKTLVMNYIKNLMAWGDYQFGIDSMESIVQATQLYVLADKILGQKPRVVPPIVKPPYQTYNQIENDLDAFGNALVELENLIPDLAVLPESGAALPTPPITMSSLYFCIPMNDKMLEYWDLVEDRLFKIRNCQNIDGVERSLALFSPPIDPGALVRSVAGGLDISAVLAGMNAPLPNYRFDVLSQKATELTQEIRGLGNALLQALEKKDAEEMSLLQNSLEQKLLKQMRTMKDFQITEADEQIKVLDGTKAVTTARKLYYQNIQRINPNEQLNLDKLALGQDHQTKSQVAQAAAAIFGMGPDGSIGGHGAGGSPAVHFTWGGSSLAQAATAASSVLSIFSSMANYEANRASILGGYDRRWDDWKFQESIAIEELKQIDLQIAVAKTTKKKNEEDLKNHDLQIKNSEKTGAFMRDKYTNKELYQWMISEISSVYFKAYKLAFDMAKKAEKCYQHELGTTDTFIAFGYWDSMKKGLLTSDQLLHDIKRMETSYLDNNKREYELTKHVSLDMLDPLALTKLKATGACDFDIPEALFDMDHPGDYFRRIKSISISIPCITGPYTSVSGKLSLISNKYRKNTNKAQGAGSPLEEYQETLGNDSRFNYNIGTIQSIATSNSQNDTGLFELNFRDMRYLPFEGTGAISSWRFELPEAVRQFDYNTIRDVIIHVHYTAREGGSTLRALASSTLTEKIGTIQQELSKTGLHKAISLRHEMPNEWHLLTTTGTVNTSINKERLPYFTQPIDTTIAYVMFVAKVTGDPANITIQINDVDLILNRNEDWGMCINQTNTIALDTNFKITSNPEDLDQIEALMMVVKYAFP